MGQWAQWSNLQRVVHKAARDHLEWWFAHGYQVLFSTLTSSPSSPKGKSLAYQHGLLRHQVRKHLGFDYEYFAVETREGCGVLHMFWAWRPGEGEAHRAFWPSVVFIREQWDRIHRARQLKIKPVDSQRYARNLNRYVVAQYCGGQDALVQFFSSRREGVAFSFPKLRKQLWRVVDGWGKYWQRGPREVGDDEVRMLRREVGERFAVAWACLIKTRSVSVYGEQYAVVDGELVAI